MTDHSTAPPEVVRLAAEKELGELLTVFPQGQGVFDPMLGWKNVTSLMQKVLGEPDELVYTYTGGAVWLTRRKRHGQWEIRELDQFRWAQVTTFTQSVVHTTHGGGAAQSEFRFRFRLEDGRRFELSELGTHTGSGKNMWHSGLENFTAVISPLVTTAQLPIAQATMVRGGSVDCGAYTVDLQGIHSWRRSLRWDQLDRVAVEGGRVRIRQRGKRLRWSSASVPSVANLELFLTLARASAISRLPEHHRPTV